MAQFLRDGGLPTLSITESRLKQIHDILIARQINLNGNLSFDEAILLPDFKSLSYTIRFDNKGYRVYSFEQLIQHFNNATKIERVLFLIENVNNRDSDTRVEIWLENGENANPRLNVTSNNSDWVDATFTTLESVILGFKSDYRWLRSMWVPPLIQIASTAVFFIISFFISRTIAPLLKMEGAFYLTFFFSFLVCIHIWGFASTILFKFLDRIFPRVYFDRQDKSPFEKWAQRSVNAAMVALCFYLLSEIGKIFVVQLSQYIN